MSIGDCDWTTLHYLSKDARGRREMARQIRDIDGCLTGLGALVIIILLIIGAICG